ncbi:ATP-binding Cassette (ABC) Superfamily [Globisporangium polare]
MTRDDSTEPRSCDGDEEADDVSRKRQQAAAGGRPKDVPPVHHLAALPLQQAAKLICAYARDGIISMRPYVSTSWVQTLEELHFWLNVDVIRESVKLQNTIEDKVLLAVVPN